MKIKNSTSQKSRVLVIVAVALVAVLSIMIVFNQDTSDETKGLEGSQDDFETPTSVMGFEELSYEKLLSGDSGKIYEDEDIKMYAINKSGKARIIYAYKEKPINRAVTDNFFLHIYIKDSTKLVGKGNYVNADFFQRSEAITTSDQVYYIFNRELVSSGYKDRELPLDVIDYISTGRFKPKTGRSQDFGKISISDLDSIELNSGLDKIYISTTKQEFQKILEKRKKALAIGVLSSADGDLIDGEITINGLEAKKMEFRLKGDWPDHLKDSTKWSYRIVMKDGETLKGMRKFSVQHPKVRNYLWEWLLNRVIKDYDIIGLRYDFAEVTLKVKDKEKDELIDMGVMAVEESFDKILIESNRKREGLIMAFDETLYWSDVKKERQLNLEGNSAVSKKIRSQMSAPIRVFNENKVLSDPTLTKQFNTAKDLLEGLRQSKYKISEVFDIDKLTTFVALYNLFDGYHGLVWHNLRMYYNPITSKFEPISFDSNSGQKLTEIKHYPYAENDPIYQVELRKKLALVSSSTYINSTLSKHREKLIALRSSLSTEYTGIFDETVLEYNSNFIKKYLDPSLQITSSLADYNENTVTVRVENLSEHPVTVSGLMHRDGRKLSTGQSITHIAKDSIEEIMFDLNRHFVNAFVSKKNKKGGFKYPKDVSKLRIAHYIEGVSIPKTSEITPYSINPNLEEQVVAFKKANTPNFESFDFIVKVSDTLLRIEAGSHSLSKDLIIPAGYTLEVAPGSHLNFKNKASIRSKAKLLCKGTPENIIKFYSSDGTGQGIFITNATGRSEVAYTTFDNLSNPQSDMWSVSGAVNFHESDVTISYVIFSNNRCEDALNIIRSEFTMTDTIFRNTQSDSFDGDFVTGNLKSCTFINSGNDGIDISGSSLVLENIKVSNPSDKGISAGENSQITGNNIEIIGGEIGIVSKDLSTVDLSNVNITDTRLGFSAFQKKSEYGVATIVIKKLTLKNIEVAHLIEVKSRLTIDNVPVKTVSNNVIDQMYGKEYGKSSR